MYQTVPVLNCTSTFNERREEYMQHTSSSLSPYQQRIILRRMLGEARQLSRMGLPRPEVMHQISAFRDYLVEEALTDIFVRQQKGHLR